MSRRNRLSTHLSRLRARSAQAHYEKLQHEATHEGPGGEYARKVCVSLGIGLTDSISVKPARHERAKWIVVAS